MAILSALPEAWGPQLLLTLMLQSSGLRGGQWGFLGSDLARSLEGSLGKRVAVWGDAGGTTGIGGGSEASKDSSC